MKAPDSVCLSDFCDVFRCDVIHGRSDANFWDTALCIEDDMTDMVSKCQVHCRTYIILLYPGVTFFASLQIKYTPIRQLP